MSTPVNLSINNIRPEVLKLFFSLHKWKEFPMYTNTGHIVTITPHPKDAKRKEDVKHYTIDMPPFGPICGASNLEGIVPLLTDFEHTLLKKTREAQELMGIYEDYIEGKSKGDQELAERIYKEMEAYTHLSEKEFNKELDNYARKLGMTSEKVEAYIQMYNELIRYGDKHKELFGFDPTNLK